MLKLLLLPLILLLACAAAFALLFVAVCLCAGLRGRHVPAADCILILGAKVKSDGSMSHALRYRCERGLEIWRSGAAPCFIACGGVCDGPASEASVIRAFLVANGVPDSAVILEDRSVNTWQNLANARSIMGDSGMSSALLVTSDYHLTRALWMARKQGLNAAGAASKSSTKPMHFLRTRFRETVSWILYFYNEIKKRF